MEAQAALGPCRAVVVRPASEELGLRIEGQSRDVACELELVASSEGATCAALAQEHGALAVMRVREPIGSGSYEVVVCDAVAGTEQVRSVTLERGDALGTSAAFEAVALVVRSALHDIGAAHEARRAEQAERSRAAREAELERERQARRARETQARASERESEDEPEEDPEEEPEDEGDDTKSAPWPWRLALGGEGVVASKYTIAIALMARALTELGPLHVGLSASFGLPVSSQSGEGHAELRIARHSALVLALLPIELSSLWTFEAGLQAGVTAITRAASSELSDIEPTDDTVRWSAVFGAELGLGLALSSTWGVRWHVGLDVVPGAPDYAYRDVSVAGEPLGETVRSSAFPVQPRFGLTLFAEL